MKKNGFPLKHSHKLIREYFSRYKNIYQLLRLLYFLFAANKQGKAS